MAEFVIFHQAKGVATITLMDIGRLNAFNKVMCDELLAELERVAADRSTRVLVIAGAGHAFCAGSDLEAVAAAKRRGARFDELRPLVGRGHAIVTRAAGLPFPTIAAINGPAIGAGLALALACDVRLASDQAVFGVNSPHLGLHPEWGVTYFLPRVVGLSKSLELCWTAETVDAAEALRIGLVTRVFPEAAFAAEVRLFTARVAAAPQTCARLAKRALGRSSQRSLAQCLDAELEAQGRCWASDDTAEGLAAFIEKREPVFTAAAGEADEPPPAALRHFE